MGLGLLTSSCSTLKESMITGIGTGAITGATAGIVGGTQKKHAVGGLLVGGLIGAVSSYFIFKGLEKRDQKIRRETLFNLEKFDVSVPHSLSNDYDGPSLTMPIIEEQWVDSQIKDGRLIEKHRIWEISEDSKLVTPAKKSKRKKK